MTSRRKFIKLCVLSTAAVPALGLLNNQALADDAMPHLDPADAQASALGYVHDTTKVDAAKYPQHKAEQKCANCQLIQGAEGEWRGCPLFAGKAVNENGWCMSWVQKAS